MVTTKQTNPVCAHTFPMQNTSWSGPPAPSACPQGTVAGSEAWILGSLKESTAPMQWQEFCEQTPID